MVVTNVFVVNVQSISLSGPYLWDYRLPCTSPVYIFRPQVQAYDYCATIVDLQPGNIIYMLQLSYATN